MKRLAVIGCPIKHSVSPPMHRAALDACGIDATYQPLEVAPDHLPAFVATLRSDGWIGVNLTVPHKEAVIPLLDLLSPESEAIGAVNTIQVREGRLVGYNTDAGGFLRSLREDGRFEPFGQDVVLLGAGGAARAVVWALARAGTGRIWVFNRHRERSVRLAEAARWWNPRTEVAAADWDQDDLESKLQTSALLVNATSVGLKESDTPLPVALIPSGILVMDLIYNPRPTRLLRDAAVRGARTLDGLSMLVHQGAEAFELWFGKPPPLDAMRVAAEKALMGENLTRLPPFHPGEAGGVSAARGGGLSDA